VSETVTRVPAVEGWYTTPEPGDPDEPHLIGAKCATCGTYVFPPRGDDCPNPACDSTELTSTPLSRKGRVWSYTENRYAPPPPFKATEPFEPYALAAVELADEGLIVLGQVAKGVLAADLEVGMEMEVGIDVLYRDDDHEYLVYVWEPAVQTADREGAQR
jgi:uncharacterized OB-fold protein